jgi:hypothetical protein
MTTATNCKQALQADSASRLCKQALQAGSASRFCKQSLQADCKQALQADSASRLCKQAPQADSASRLHAGSASRLQAGSASRLYKQALQADCMQALQKICFVYFASKTDQHRDIICEVIRCINGLHATMTLYCFERCHIYISLGRGLSHVGRCLAECGSSSNENLWSHSPVALQTLVRP